MDLLLWLLLLVRALACAAPYVAGVAAGLVAIWIIPLEIPLAGKLLIFAIVAAEVVVAIKGPPSDE